jgi:hypothetical protein
LYDAIDGKISMDLVTIATGFLALVGPYVTGKAATALVTAAGKKVAETGALDLYNSIKGFFNFKPGAKTSVARFEANEPGAKEALIKQLTDFLEKNPDIRETMHGIVAKNQQLVAEMIDQSTSTMTIGNVTIGDHGTLTNIDRVHGNVTINGTRKS